MVAHFSDEEEYRVMTSTICELTWLKSLLVDLSFTIITSMILFAIIKRPCILSLT
jgi:hypothetical protein